MGRIAAVVNHSHNQFHHDKVGFFGFFDCAEDKEAAAALFREASKILKAKGCESLRGPYNPTVNDECGCLVEGFERAPFVMMPYNPPYYGDLYESSGLKQVRDLFAFYISAETQAPERIEKIVNRVKRSTGVTVRNLEMKRLSEELKIIQRLYNETLDRNWGFVPITLEDLEFAASDLKAIVDPSMVMIAEKDGQAVGFSMTIPNINELMWKAKTSKGIMRILKFVWYLKMKHPKEARLAILGVAPEYRNKGIAALFYYETLIRGKKKYIGGELSWVEETNEDIIKAIQVMGGQKYKTYRIFEAPLSI